MSSKLEQLLQKLCPNGVTKHRLGEIAKLKNGKAYSHLTSGNIPVYGSGGIMTHVNQCVYDKPSVLIPRKGSLNNLFYVDEPFWNVDTIFHTEINTDLVVPKFLYYLLQKEHLEDLNMAGGVPSLTQSMLNDLQISVPPIEIQNEIVRILDKLTELTARQKQYEYYRDQLLNFENRGGYNILTINELCIIHDNKRKPITKRNRISGTYPYYGANGIQDYIEDYLLDGEFVLVGEDGSVMTSTGNPVVTWAQGKIWVNNHAHVISAKSGVLIRYLFHYIKTINIQNLVHGTPPKLTGKDFKALPIPIPPMDIQRQLVSILDRFEALCTDLKSGLPAEIEARKKQYEYYRDKLLTFTPLAES